MAVMRLKKKYRSVDTVKTRNKPSSSNSGKSNKSTRRFTQDKHPNDKPVVFVIHADGRRRFWKQEDYERHRSGSR